MSWDKLSYELRQEILQNVFARPVFNHYKNGPDKTDCHLQYLEAEQSGSAPCARFAAQSRYIFNLLLVSKEMAEEAKEAFLSQNDLLLNVPSALTALDLRNVRRLQSLGPIRNVLLNTMAWIRISRSWYDGQSQKAVSRLMPSLKATLFPGHRLRELSIGPVVHVNHRRLVFFDLETDRTDFPAFIRLALRCADRIKFTVRPDEISTTSDCVVVVINKKRQVIVQGYLRVYIDDAVSVLLNSYGWHDGQVFKLIHQWPRNGGLRTAVVGPDLTVT